LQLDVSEDELQRRIKALQAADAAAAAAAADASAAKATTANGGSKKGGTARPSVAGAAAGTAAMVPSPFAAPQNNLKDWGRRMEAYRQILQEEAADLAAKVGTCGACGWLLRACPAGQEGWCMCCGPLGDGGLWPRGGGEGV
jgi:hypothetical protein